MSIFNKGAVYRDKATGAKYDSNIFVANTQIFSSMLSRMESGNGMGFDLRKSMLVLRNLLEEASRIPMGASLEDLCGIDNRIKNGLTVLQRDIAQQNNVAAMAHLDQVIRDIRDSRNIGTESQTADQREIDNSIVTNRIMIDESYSQLEQLEGQLTQIDSEIDALMSQGITNDDSRIQRLDNHAMEIEDSVAAFKNQLQIKIKNYNAILGQSRVLQNGHLYDALPTVIDVNKYNSAAAEIVKKHEKFIYSTDQAMDITNSVNEALNMSSAANGNERLAARQSSRMSRMADSAASVEGDSQENTRATRSSRFNNTNN